jgi:hypothetical protein
VHLKRIDVPIARDWRARHSHAYDHRPRLEIQGVI